MQEFEAVIFCGLKSDQYDILWVEHADKDIDDTHPVGRLELNFVIPCQELRSGKSFQPYYEPADQKRVNAWKNIINSEVKTIKGEPLSDPNDPERKRLVNPYSNHAPRPTPFDIKTYTKKMLKRMRRPLPTLLVVRYWRKRLSVVYYWIGKKVSL